MGSTLTKRELQKLNRLARVLETERERDLGNDPFTSRFNQHFPKSGDPIAAILKGHLLAEELLYKLLALAARDPSLLDQARLSFAQLLVLVKAMSPFPSDFWIWSALTDLNAIRNRLAHHLDAKDVTARSKALARSIVSRQTKPTVKDGKEELSAELPYLLGFLSAQCRIASEAKRVGATDIWAHALHKATAGGVARGKGEDGDDGTKAQNESE